MHFVGKHGFEPVDSYVNQKKGEKAPKAALNGRFNYASQGKS